MDVMKALNALAAELEAAQAQKATLREKIEEADQGVSQMLGELQKAAATHLHVRCALHAVPGPACSLWACEHAHVMRHLSIVRCCR